MPSRFAQAAMALLLLTAVPRAAPAEEFRVRMGPSASSFTVRRALAGASERLRTSECRRLLTDFEDEQGRPLQERLDTFGFSPDEFLGYVGFYEGEGHVRCHHDNVLAFTAPGSLAVRVCPRVARHDPETVEIVLIHEMLHALGLGENPPTSSQITNEVRRRCGDVSVRSARR